MSEKVTVDVIARLAHVSRATVSRVLNQHPHISDDVRRRVLAVIDQLGYQPNAMARGLAGKRTMNVGVVVIGVQPNYLSHGVFYEVLLGAQETLSAVDYDLLLYSSREAADERFLRRILAKSQVDGLIVMGEFVAAWHLELLLTGRIPIVTVGRKVGPPVPYVSVDNIQGARLATRHLIDLGHRRIGIIRGLPGLQPGMDRLLGYQSVLEEAGIPFDPALAVPGTATREAGWAGMEQLLALPDRPTAVFGCSDPTAIGALECCQHHAIRVPDEIAIVGFDDIPAASMVRPALTTVRQPKAELGRRAVRLLLDQLNGGGEVGGGIYLDPELILRESCGHRREEEAPSP